MSLEHIKDRRRPRLLCRGRRRVITVQKPRAVGLLPVCLTMKPVGEPDALIGHVRFDERGWETERCRKAQATAPILDSAKAADRCGANVWTLSEVKCSREDDYEPCISSDSDGRGCRQR